MYMKPSFVSGTQDTDSSQDVKHQLSYHTVCFFSSLVYISRLLLFTHFCARVTTTENPVPSKLLQKICVLELLVFYEGQVKPCY